MATVIRDNIVLCMCCAIAAANGDVSGCEDGERHTPHALTSPTIGGYIVVGESHEVYTSASWLECYGCGQQMEYGQTVFKASVLG